MARGGGSTVPMGGGATGAAGGNMANPPTPVGERPIPGRSPFDVVNDGGMAPTFGGGLPYNPPVTTPPTPSVAPPMPPSPYGGGASGGVGGQWVDAGYGQGPLNANGMQQAIPPSGDFLRQPAIRPPAPGGPPGPAQQPGPQGRPPFGPPGPYQTPGPSVLPPMQQQPSMPAGLPPQGVGGAPVNGKPAQSGMSGAAGAEAQMMKRANVTQINPYQKPKKPAPMPAVEPKPMA